jgi:F-type H+-transporting ATPase subunit a
VITSPLLLFLAAHSDEAAHAADTVAHAAEHGAEHGGAPELPNILHMLYLAFGETFHSWHHWENVIFGFVVLLFFCFISMRIYSKRNLRHPGKLQNLAEIAVEGLDNFFHSVLGRHAERYTPFLGTLFVYILCMNLMGLVPFLKSPTSSLNITLSLALIVFVYVQFAGVRRLGPLKYVDHLMGEPRDVMGWVLVPLNLPIHILGELAKPVSLSLRLFGNITGEDVLIAAFTGLGIALLAFMGSPVGVPLQVPFYFLAILTSTIQALVFTLLSTVYFALMMPHEKENH